MTDYTPATIIYSEGGRVFVRQGEKQIEIVNLFRALEVISTALRQQDDKRREAEYKAKKAAGKKTFFRRL